MDEQRKKLLEQIKILKLPMKDEEAEKDVAEMTDEEVTKLIEFYGEMIDYENEVEDFVRQYAPDDYHKLLKERDEKIKKKELDAQHELERLQEEKDIRLDAEDAKNEREIEDVVTGIENDAEQVEEMEADLYKMIKNSGSIRDNKNTDNV